MWGSWPVSSLPTVQGRAEEQTAFTKTLPTGCRNKHQTEAQANTWILLPDPSLLKEMGEGSPALPRACIQEGTTQAGMAQPNSLCPSVHIALNWPVYSQPVPIYKQPYLSVLCSPAIEAYRKGYNVKSFTTFANGPQFSSWGYIWSLHPAMLRVSVIDCNCCSSCIHT